MKHLLPFAVLNALLATLAGLAAPLPLVRGEGTTYVIYQDATAPSSVPTAASGLQHYLYEACKAKLAIVNEPTEPMICLGDNASAREAGVTTEGIPLEGFRVVTKGQNLYLLGPDTGDEEQTPLGGPSTGPRNGA